MRNSSHAHWLWRPCWPASPRGQARRPSPSPLQLTAAPVRCGRRSWMPPPGAVMIGFNIPGAGVQTIEPQSLLPFITRTVTMDGYTRPGASPNTLANADNAVLLIELSGGSPNAPPYGLLFAANACTVRGLVVNRFVGAGLWTQISD